MIDLVAKAKRYARSSATVLVTGESGTGKERLSRLIHAESPRADKNFVAVNCAALPELLVESELFGHERGAFTGAFHQRVGHFQFAHRGTILLDEVTEIPLSVQAKLLRAIEEQEVQRLGSNQPEKIDVRIVATSNRHIPTEIADGAFRLDLYYRLNVLRIEIPPLRKRPEDIPLLAHYFLKQFQHESGQPIKGFTRDAMDRLVSYSWPGNVRQLRNMIQAACIECGADLIDGIDLSFFDDAGFEQDAAPLQLEDAEKQMILTCLDKHRGNKTAAAAELGVTARTLRNKLRVYKAA